MVKSRGKALYDAPRRRTADIGVILEVVMNSSSGGCSGLVVFGARMLATTVPYPVVDFDIAAVLHSVSVKRCFVVQTLLS